MKSNSSGVFSCLLLLGLFLATPVNAAALKSPAKLDNATCQTCHDSKLAKTGKLLAAPDAEGNKRALRPIHNGKFGKSVHANMQCVACHTDISNSTTPHKKTKAAKIDCAQCHEALWGAAKLEGTTEQKPRLGTIVQNIEAYKKSYHGRINGDDSSRVNATCDQCHDTHTFDVPPNASLEHKEWRQNVPQLCGEKCHSDQLDDYSKSVHGQAIQKNTESAICTDCHNNHAIGSVTATPTKLAITANCGDCHEGSLKSYLSTYHGQVVALGYPYTAKCYDCHGGHSIQGAKDPASRIHPSNRLKTCQRCHQGVKALALATPGFETFAPHANGHDFKKYPQMWIATKLMVALLIFVFVFFWAHCLLWYNREWMDRLQGKTVSHVNTEALGLLPEKHFQRFSWGWRIAHLALALVTMTLVMTGSTAMFAGSNWAPAIAAAVGGPKVLGYIHRICASLFAGIFLIHLIYLAQRLLRDKNFRWFGPDSLIPNWKDLSDCVGMFKWFVGKGPRPQFDRWTYFEKFDYWAVFWGVNIIGWSGLMLAFPHVTATYLPGWVFNVATLVHGVEAFLAAVFHFTVHFFNSHFRPDKLPPPDVVMFTGTQSIAEFRADHPAHYQRLVDTGELEKYLVDAPSRPMHIGSVILGMTLIGLGFLILVFVIVGFFSW